MDDSFFIAKNLKIYWGRYTNKHGIILQGQKCYDKEKSQGAVRTQKRSCLKVKGSSLKKVTIKMSSQMSKC